MNKHRLLEIAEYISIFATLAGSTIAVTTGQIIYATVPMTLALLLNLIGRSQFEKQVQQRVNENHTERYQQIADDIQFLKTTFLETYFQGDFDKIQQYFISLSDNLNLLQTHSQPSSESINSYQNLQDTLNSLVYRMLADGVLSSREAGASDQGIANIILAYRNYKEEYKKSYSAMFPEEEEDFEADE
ncbi:hypothetical protein [Anabaena sphaerica]|uniref:hypothetical protein n=1 Tax=Anabaena sphaerica TaxID=212446 RepID=UPI0018F0002D|nr:hypothetical protein [Anabaena sphaerica]